MGTSIDQIRFWLKTGEGLGATHVIIACDTFEYEDYPVYVSSGQDPRQKSKEYDGVNMQKIVEVYNLTMDIESQLSEHRAIHYENE